MTMQDYIDPTWRPILERNELGDFDALWRLEAGWLEEPNRKRKGWSGVSKIPLALPDGTLAWVYLKRQEDNNTLSWRHPIAGIPTFAREFHHIQRYRAFDIPTLDPVFFGVRTVAGKARAILATVELSGFIALDAWLAEEPRPRTQRLDCLDAVAATLRAMHRQRIRHSCFFPKHIFVRVNQTGGIELRIIDLEKSRRIPLRVGCTLRDLDSLNRHASGWSRTDRLRFLLRYLGVSHVTPYARWLWGRLTVRRAKKLGQG